MRKLQEEIRQKEERQIILSNMIDKTNMQDAEMAAKLQRLQAGEERRGSNASQTGDCCLEALWQQLVALGANGTGSSTPGRCQEEKKDKGIVKMNQSKAESVQSCATSARRDQ